MVLSFNNFIIWKTGRSTTGDSVFAGGDSTGEWCV